MSFDAIVARVERNAATNGFERKEGYGFDSVWHRRKFMPSRLGMVDAILTVRSAEFVTKSDLVRYEDDALAAVLDMKIWLPRGLGSALEMYAITVAGTADAAAIEYVRTSMRNRWSAMTLHALFHGDPPQSVVFAGRKIWGGAYVKGLLAQLTALVS